MVLIICGCGNRYTASLKSLNPDIAEEITECIAGHVFPNHAFMPGVCFTHQKLEKKRIFF